MTFSEIALELIDGLISIAVAPVDRMVERAAILGQKCKKNGGEVPSIDTLKEALTMMFPADAKHVSSFGWDNVHNAFMDAYLRA